MLLMFGSAVLIITWQRGLGNILENDFYASARTENREVEIKELKIILCSLSSHFLAVDS